MTVLGLSFVNHKLMENTKYRLLVTTCYSLDFRLVGPACVDRKRSNEQLVRSREICN